MSVEQYWIGKDVDVESIWEDYERGKGYIEKFQSMDVHLFKITFQTYPDNMPVFNAEAILKSIKSLYHDLKFEALSSEEYNEYGPIFLYDLDRGSEVWRFLGEYGPLLLTGAFLLHNKLVHSESQLLDMEKKKMDLFEQTRKLFPNRTDEEIAAYVNAWTVFGKRSKFKKLAEQNVKKIEISRKPFNGNIKKAEKNMIDITEEGN